MIFTLTKRVGTFAIILADDSTVEKIDTDRVAIISVVINPLTGVCQFAFAFGGVDSSGRFHLDPKRADDLAHVVITRNQDNRSAFDQTFLDDKLNPHCHYPREFFKQLAVTLLLRAAFQLYWGAKYPDIEVWLDDELVFKHEVPQAQ